MKKILILGFLALLVGGCNLKGTQNVSQTSPQKDNIYQVATIDALLNGLYDGYVSLGELKKHGDFGLGTFDGLDGEMIMLDGKVYQANVDGKIYEMKDEIKSPFAVVNFFNTDQTQYITGDNDMQSLLGKIDTRLPSSNLFYAIKVKGTFKNIKVRSVPKQTPPYQKLSDVIGSGQVVFEYQDISGTLVGYKSPYFVQGANVPGYHLHFISDDKTKGGHVLGFDINTGEVQIDNISDFELSLPNDKNFYEFSNSTQEDELQKVEKGK